MSGSSAPGARRRLGVGAALVVMIAAAAIAVVIGMVRTSTAASVDEIPAAPASVVPATVYVHVHGAVLRPGLYRLALGARVVDLVAAAGGFADDAEQAGVNLARELADGEQVRVPVFGEEPPAGEVSSDGRVNINTADAGALESLPRIGPAIAQRIIAWRDDHGRFTSVEDLRAIPGIGDKMLAALRDLVTV